MVHPTSHIFPSLSERIQDYLESYQAWLETETLADSEEIPVYSRIYSLDRGWIAESGNSAQTNQDPTLHSEILTMKQALSSLGRKYLTGCEMFTNLEPCYMCGVAILKYRIQRVVYFVGAAPGQGISSFPVDLIYQSYHFPELIYIPMENLKGTMQGFFKKKRGTHFLAR